MIKNSDADCVPRFWRIYFTLRDRCCDRRTPVVIICDPFSQKIKRLKGSGQNNFKWDSRAKDPICIVIAPHLFACNSYGPHRLKAPFVGVGNMSEWLLVFACLLDATVDTGASDGFLRSKKHGGCNKWWPHHFGHLFWVICSCHQVFWIQGTVNMQYVEHPQQYMYIGPGSMSNTVE